MFCLLLRPCPSLSTLKTQVKKMLDIFFGQELHTTGEREVEETYIVSSSQFSILCRKQPYFLQKKTSSVTATQHFIISLDDFKLSGDALTKFRIYNYSSLYITVRCSSFFLFCFCLASLLFEALCSMTMVWYSDHS